MVICALAAVAYIDFTSMSRMRADILIAKTAALELANIDNTQSVTSAQVAGLAARSDTLGTLILTKDAIPQFLGHLESLAGASGVVLDVVNVEAMSRDNVQMLTISFSVKGTQAGVQEFLDTLQGQPQAIRFAQLNVVFGAGATTSASGILEIISFKQ